MVAGGWGVVRGGWWLVAAGWWLGVGGWLLVGKDKGLFLFPTIIFYCNIGRVSGIFGDWWVVVGWEDSGWRQLREVK